MIQGMKEIGVLASSGKDVEDTFSQLGKRLKILGGNTYLHVILIVNTDHNSWRLSLLKDK